MGKYMRKAKPAAEVAVMDFTQAALGVRTRARTLALQKSASVAAAAASPAAEGAGDGAGAAYLELRNRRLFKPPLLPNDSPRRPKQAQGQSNSNASSRNKVEGDAQVADAGSPGSGGKTEIDKEEEIQEVEEDDAKDDDDLAVEASFGENVLDSEPRERSTRESTPCSLIRDPEDIRTPGSTTRPARSMENRVQNSTRRPIPTATEMDEFFAGAEEEQQKQFVEKYNYDPVNDKPLPGRYQWEKVDP